VWLDKVTCKLYVPAGAVADYQVAEGWSDFANILEEEALVPQNDYAITFSVDIAMVDNAGAVVVGIREEVSVPVEIPFPQTNRNLIFVRK